MRRFFLLFGLLLGSIIPAFSQVYTEPFTGVISSVGYQPGPGLFSAPIGSQVSGAFTINLSDFEAPSPVANGNQWFQYTETDDSDLTGNILPNTDSLYISTINGSATIPDIEGLYLTTTDQDLVFGFGQNIFAAIVTLGCAQPPFNPSLGAFPLVTPNCGSALLQIQYTDDTGAAYAMIINLRSLSGTSDNQNKALGSCGCGGSVSGQISGATEGVTPGVADPINTATGNVFEQVSDYATTGANVLGFTRYYDSQGDPGSLAKSLGSKWRSNFDRYLRIASSTKITTERADGQELVFTLQNGVWVSDSDVDITLANTDSSWTLTDHNDTLETYTTVSATEAILSSSQSRNGYTQTLAYNNRNQLTKVADSYGRTLHLDYLNGLLHTVTTPDGTELTYGYTSSGLTPGVLDRLASVTYSKTPQTSQTYLYENTTLPLSLTGIIDENGNRYATWAYDGLGRAVLNYMGSLAIQANATTVQYDDATGTRTVTNALGQSQLYKFAILQGIPKLVEIDRLATSTTSAATRVFTYDNNGYLASQTDWHGNKTTFVNNVHGQPSSITEAVGTAIERTTATVYDSVWVHLPKTTTTSGLTTGFTYDGSGNLLTSTLTDTTTGTVPYSTSGQKRVSSFTYGNHGLLATAKGPRTDVNATTTYTYGSDGALTAVKDALGHTTKITAHSGGGLPETIVDPNGVTTTLTYDARLNLESSTIATSAGSLVTSYGYDAANNQTSVQLPDGSSVTNTYDAAHRLTGTTDRLGNSISYNLDALGDRTLIETKNAANVVTRTHSAKFDALGRKIGDIGGGGQTTTLTYDNNGHLITLSPPSPSGTITYGYDALNRRTTTKDPSPGGTTTVSYDAHDRPLTVKDANGHTTSYTYDGFGDRTQTVSPDSGTTTYRFDAAGNPTQSVKPGPLTQNATYDALNRPLTTTYPSDATLNVARVYDQTGHGFGVGRLTSAQDQAGTLSVSYDERGNATQESRTVTGAGTLKTTTAYDAASRVSGIKYPSGTTVAYGRDSMGRVADVLAGPPGAATPSTLVSGITYEPFGPETALTFGNGVKGNYAYDLDYRPTTRTETGTVPLQKLTYGYLANNSVKTITDGVNASDSQTFGYDALDRLTSAVSGAGGYGSQSFVWDPVGNITSRNFSGTVTNFAYVSGSNRLAQAQDVGSDPEIVSSSAAGNLAQLTVDGYVYESVTYNQANQLASATSMTTGSSSYDLFGQRLKKALPGEYPILYQFSRTGGQLLSENDLHGGQTADYIYLNGRPIGEIDPTNGTIYFTHTDRLGTPQKLTDSSQKLVWSALYQPFGSTGMTVNALITQSLRFPGQQFDPETGLNHNGFRDYSPDLGRYVESDPIGLAGGLNTYAYGRSNPLHFTDGRGFVALDGFIPSPIDLLFRIIDKEDLEQFNLALMQSGFPAAVGAGEVLQEAEVLAVVSGEEGATVEVAGAQCSLTPDTNFTHFTDSNGLGGITGLDTSALSSGQSLTVNELKFGIGTNDYLAGKSGDIFVTDLSSDASSLSLSQIGVFGEQQNFAITFSGEGASGQGVLVRGQGNSIFTIPGGSTLIGCFSVLCR